MKWLTKAWWSYILRRPDSPGYTSGLKRLLCRIKGHPNGMWFYNLNGNSPDTTCKDCGDNIG